MEFIKLIPGTRRKKDSAKKVRILFARAQNKYDNLLIFIGKTVADQVGLHQGDKVSFSYDNENNRTFLVKKSVKNLGFKLSKHTNNIYKIQLAWDLSTLDDKDYVMKEVSYDIEQNGIKIYS